uniref:Uncharacterized protein n=1 Tax=Ciona savignyi TaxID=51511 RepID=H2YIW5_CIOSA
NATLSPAQNVYVALENIVTAQFRSVYRALAYFFCSFFVFNMKYPDKSCLTMDFFHRYIANVQHMESKFKPK